MKYASASFPVSCRYVMRPKAVPYPCHVSMQKTYCSEGLVHTEVARDPVLHTVMTLRPSPVPPAFLTRSTSQSPPHFAMALFLDTSSSSIALPSATRSVAIDRASFPAVMPSLSTLVSLRVAAPRFTAVGRDLYR